MHFLTRESCKHTFPSIFHGNHFKNRIKKELSWQQAGLGWRGWQGRGYALGVGEVKLTGMVRPDRKKLTYKIDFTKAIQTRRLTMGVANGIVEADGEVIYMVKDMKVALSET